MQVETIDSTLEEPVLISMITNLGVLGKIATVWDKNLFFSKWSNIIGNWCVLHYRKYGCPPKSAIEHHFRTWTNRQERSKEVVDLIEKFLVRLSNHYETNYEENTQLQLDAAHSHFNRVRLTRLLNEAKDFLQSGSFDKAEEKVLTYNRIGLNEQAGTDLLNDELEVRSTFDVGNESIIQYPDGAGKFFGDALGRDCFFSWLAGEKVGKTWSLVDLAWRALEQRRKVAFFEVGDMSKRQIKKRFLCRAAGHPFRSPENIWPFSPRIPDTIEMPELGKLAAKVSFRQKPFDKPLNEDIAWEACKSVMNKTVKSHDSFLRISVHPNSTINVEGIESILTEWELRGFTSDVVVIDYADILGPPSNSSKQDIRDPIHKTWKQLRALASKKHCLVATATQATRESYDKPLLDRRHVSDDKRKLGEVSSMAGINVFGEEKELGLCRFNWIAVREQEYNSRRCCYVAGCLPIGNPCVLSVY